MRSGAAAPHPESYQSPSLIFRCKMMRRAAIDFLQVAPIERSEIRARHGPEIVPGLRFAQSGPRTVVTTGYIFIGMFLEE